MWQKVLLLNDSPSRAAKRKKSLAKSARLKNAAYVQVPLFELIFTYVTNNFFYLPLIKNKNLLTVLY